jgi:hypothetical protein
MQTSREFASNPGIAHDRISFGAGGVAGEVNIECRIACVIGEIRDGNIRRATVYGEVNIFSPAGPPIVVSGLEAKDVNTFVTTVRMGS